MGLFETDGKMKSFKIQYRDKLIEHFEKNKMPYSKEMLKSILSKVSIHSRNKYGEVSFEDELFESNIDNGFFFYHEYNKKNTFNRSK